ncbi:hypothetical protein ACHHYP_06416 [Achlya hypogyna]|uniref:START domain-containing protein n=1 Tax=Achlya hypogyna TaxID=1202772 RepID=A0A1V9YTT6_ACHHY|nr:hypothetical protein ACHHYP_06416 [Achlya hypogyna]
MDVGVFDDPNFLGLLSGLRDSDSSEDINDDSNLPPAKKRARVSLRAEIAHLRCKHDVLSARLAALEALDPLPVQSAWAERAKEQAVAAQVSLHENARLRDALQGQLRLIATLQRAFTRAPGISSFPSLAMWKFGALGHTKRHETMATIAANQRSQLATEWIRQNMHNYEVTDETVRKRFLSTSSDGSTLFVNVIECMTWDVEMATLATVIWDLFTRQCNTDPEVFVLDEVVEQCDRNMAYLRFVATMPGLAMPPVEGRTIAHRFIEDNRVVIVSKSVLEDALCPVDPSHFIDNQCSWTVVQHSGPGKTRLMMYSRLTPPVATPASIEKGFTPGMYTDSILQLLDSMEMWSQSSTSAISSYLINGAEPMTPTPALAALLGSNDDTFSAELSALVPLVDEASLRTALRPPKRQRTRLKDELEYLRGRHMQLAAELSALQATARSFAPPAFWKGRAQSQARAVQQAQAENQQLREALESQLRVVASLQRLFAKKPKLCTFPSLEDWRLPSLGVSRRHETLEELLRHQCDQLSSHWVRYGLHDAESHDESVLQANVTVMGHGDGLVLDCIKCATYPAPSSQIGNIVWALLNCRQSIDVSKTLQKKAVEVFSDALVYTQFLGDYTLSPSSTHGRLPTIESRIACRRYVDEDKVVIIWRSILDDALFPWPSHHLKGNECGWVVISNHGPSKARLVSYSNVTPPMMSSAANGSAIRPGMLTESIVQQVEDCLQAVDVIIEKAIALDHTPGSLPSA